jgi:hypothetical protein
MLQKFIHGPFSPNAPDFSALNEADFAGESNAPQVFTSRMDIESSVPFEMQDFGGSVSAGRMHESDFEDSSVGDRGRDNKRGGWFTVMKTIGF